MPYQGVALAVLLGVGIATAAILYFLNQREESPYSYGEKNRGPPPDTSFKQWDQSKPTDPGVKRRRRCAIKQSPDRCAICYDDLQCDIKKLSCNHIFHGACIRKWLEQAETRNCPICRKLATM